MSLPNNLILS